MRTLGSAADLQAMRGHLRRVVARYAVAVLSTLDEDEPETLAVVEQALLPVLRYRQTRASTAVVEDAGAVEDEGAAEVEPEPEAQQGQEVVEASAE